jgi:hypothetical protein
VILGLEKPQDVGLVDFVKLGVSDATYFGDIGDQI